MRDAYFPSTHYAFRVTHYGHNRFDTSCAILLYFNMLKLAVIDGQGGGIGSLVVKRLRDEFGDSLEILALGTNATATAAMMKSRANKGATGENAIVLNASRADILIGPLSIALPNAMLGELTPRMAEAIVLSNAKKFLLPLNQEGVNVIGVEKEPLPHMIEKIVDVVRQEVGEGENYVRS
jgi:hypothetical protein